MKTAGFQHGGARLCRAVTRSRWGSTESHPTSCRFVVEFGCGWRRTCCRSPESFRGEGGFVGGQSGRGATLRGSKPVNILPMTDPLDFNQFQIRDNFINDAIVAKTDAISVLRSAQFFHAVRKWILCQTPNRPDNSFYSTCGQFAQVFARGFLPLNAKGHSVSALS